MGEGDALGQLGEIYAAGALPETSATRAARLLAALLHSLGANVGFLGTRTPDGKAIDVFRVTPESKNLVRLAFPVDAPYPLAHTVRTEAAVFIESNDQLHCDHPGLVRVESADHACATVPLYDEHGTLLGAVNVTFEDPHEFTSGERSLIAATAERVAEVLRS